MKTNELQELAEDNQSMEVLQRFCFYVEELREIQFYHFRPPTP